MSIQTVETLEEILKEKLRKAIQPLSKQIKDTMQSVNALKTKYDQIAKTLTDLDEAKESLILDIRVLRSGMLLVITSSFFHLNILRKSSNQILLQIINWIICIIQFPSSVS